MTAHTWGELEHELVEFRFSLSFQCHFGPGRTSMAQHTVAAEGVSWKCDFSKTRVSERSLTRSSRRLQAVFSLGLIPTL